MCCKSLSQDELKAYLEFQLTKFADWKYLLGCKMECDPLNYFSLDELITTYINRHGQELHEEWYKIQG